MEADDLVADRAVRCVDACEVLKEEGLGLQRAGAYVGRRAHDW
jgi:hypothetical protein